GRRAARRAGPLTSTGPARRRRTGEGGVMADPKGFLTTPRVTPARRPVSVRISDWREVYTEFGTARLELQAGRCMDCGIPFCHQGCPLGNLIPEWNDLVWREDWEEAARRLHATNNFPEFTGRLCPAPCESACVLGINSDPVTIKQVEVEIADRALASGWAAPEPPAALTGRTVAVVGSGPAGLAAAQQLTRAGHTVTVYERAEAPGGQPRGRARHGAGHQRARAARGDHRRRRHRGRLPGHRAPAGRRVGDPARDHAPAARPAPGRTALAHLPDDLPGVQRPRRGRRA